MLFFFDFFFGSIFTHLATYLTVFFTAAALFHDVIIKLAVTLQLLFADGLQFLGGFLLFWCQLCVNGLVGQAIRQ